MADCRDPFDFNDFSIHGGSLIGLSRVLVFIVHIDGLGLFVVLEYPAGIICSLGLPSLD